MFYLISITLASVVLWISHGPKSGKMSLHSQAEQKLPGMIISFQNHTKLIMKTANQKLSGFKAHH